MLRCITPKEMRDINRTCILEYLRLNGEVSRSAIANSLGLSLSSVVRITDELTEDRLVRLSGRYEFSGGRRRPLIELDTRQNVVVSITLGGVKVAACLCDITGNMLETHTVLSHGARGEDCVTLLKTLADEMLSAAEDRTVRGVSVGVPGIVIGGNRVIAAPTVGLDNFLLADRLSPLFPCPVMVENDVNLAALGELWFGYGRQYNDLLYLHIGTLVGLGIILDRCVIHGAHTGAGELGSMLLDQALLPKQFSGVGALEESISGYGLGKRTKQALTALQRKNDAATAKDLFEYAAGERWARDIVTDFEEKLSMALVNLSALFDPGIIVLGGGVMESAYTCLPKIRQRIHGKTPNPIRVERTRLGSNVGTLGGSVSVLQRVTHYTMIKSMI